MTCHEIEALKLGLMNVLGSEDRSARKHARDELGDDLSGPIEALADADTIADIQRHLDAALVDLEEEVAAASEDDANYDYLRGRLVAVRDAESAIGRFADQGEGILAGLGDAHDLLHETFPDDE